MVLLGMKNDFIHLFDNSESIKYYMRFRLLASEKAFSCFNERI